MGSIRFESAQTHEAVQLPASIADLDAALAKVNGDNLTHLSVRIGSRRLATARQLLQKETISSVTVEFIFGQPPLMECNGETLGKPQTIHSRARAQRASTRCPTASPPEPALARRNVFAFRLP